MNVTGERVTACRLKGNSEQGLFTPDGWEFEGSLSQRFGHQEVGDFSPRYRYVRFEDGIVVY